MAKILVVDAGSVNRRFVAALLRNHGHRPLEASRREEALRLARAERPELVVADVQLAEGDIIELVLDLRAEAVPQRIVLRAGGELEAQARAVARILGAGFIAKPANPQALLAALERALADPALRERDVSADDALLRPVVGLVRGLAERRGRLEAARAALELEIRKRLLAERLLGESIFGLRDQSLRDPLTGLYNRRYLDESLEREESRARRSGQPFTVLMIDVDHFKRFNDTLGHAAGDAVLRDVARFIASAARGEDIVARYGGDEFTLVMAQAPRAAAVARAETLIAGTRALKLDAEAGNIGPVTLSVGVAVFPDHGDSARAVLAVADAALLRGKQSGRARVALAE
jgi:diguanylate cyclase (GGDEF)-like protein